MRSTNRPTNNKNEWIMSDLSESNAHDICDSDYWLYYYIYFIFSRISFMSNDVSSHYLMPV